MVIWVGWVYGISTLCRLFNAKSSLYVHILNIYALVGFSFMAYQPL